jgi:D-xylose transport system substrate-binding protein
MRKAMASIAMLGLLATGALSACTDDSNDTASGSSGGGKSKATGEGKIGIILPDTKSSQRWKEDDPKYLKQAFTEAGVPYDLQNAEGDKTRFVQIADQMIQSGVKVLMIVNLDSPSGKVVLDKAKAAGVKTIDYDRLTLNGGADYYVSFDNFEVGQLQGSYLRDCIKQKDMKNPVVAEINGSPTDNNATDFKGGYDSILQPLYDSAAYTKGPDQSVPDWVNEEAGVIFAQMFQQQPRIRAVVAANDGLANAVIGVLKKKKLNGVVPVTGQDSTVQGLQNILTGDQCMTVYKEIKPEAQQAAQLAIQLFKGEKPAVTRQQKDAESGAYVPFLRLRPKAITKANINIPIDAGFADKKQVCAGKYAKLCEEAGIDLGDEG